jgi:glycosyltransferase involved in cell wall biosynthesis
LTSRSTSPPSVSIVVITHNEGERLAHTVHCLLATMPRDGELVVVDDCSTDASCDVLRDRFPGVRLVRPETRLGVAGSRNFGAAHAGSETLVFSDAHVDPSPGWAEALLPALQRPDAGLAAPAVTAIDNPSSRGYGMTWRDASLNVEWLPLRGHEPYPVPFLAGMFLACRRTVFEACGRFDEGLVGWGSEDIELCLRLWALGYDCLVVPGAQVAHLFRPRFPYAVDAVAVLQNLLRMAIVHLDRDRLEPVLAALCRSPYFAAAMAGAIDGDVWAHREQVRGRRHRDDKQFCSRFGIDLFGPVPKEVPT